MESASAVGALASEQPIDLPHASTLQNYEAAFLKHVIEGEKRSEARSSPCRHRQRANSVALKRARWPLLRSSLMRRNVHVLLLLMLGLGAGLPVPVRAQSNPASQGATVAVQQGAQPKPSQEAAQPQQARQLAQQDLAQQPSGTKAAARMLAEQKAVLADPNATEEDRRFARRILGIPPETYSVGALSVAIVVFAVLGLLFWLQLYWSNKLDQAGYLGTLYKDTLEEIEYKRLKSECDNRLNAGEYDKAVARDVKWLTENPRPDEPEGYQSFSRRPGGYVPPLLPGLPRSSSTGGLGGSTGSGIQENPGGAPDPKFIEDEHKRRDWDEKLQAKVNANYSQDLANVRNKAAELASKAINIDLSVLRGRGAEFVLGFTTIVAIVFAAVALGVLGKLDSQQIGTLFAAISGYVLGRATATRGAVESEQPRGSSSVAAIPTQQRQPGQQT